MGREGNQGENPTRLAPEQPTKGDTSLSRVLDQGSLEVPSNLSHPVILWKNFCPFSKGPKNYAVEI